MSLHVVAGYYDPETGITQIWDVPPEPWPDIPDDFVFGPEWGEPPTVYVFTLDQLVERKVGQIEEDAFKWILRRLKIPVVDGTGSWWLPMRFIRAGIHAQLGDSEDLMHMIALRAKTDTNPVDEGSLRQIGSELAGYVHTWFTSNAYLTGSRPVSALFWNGLRYDEIRLSFLEQTEGTDKHGNGGNLTTLIDTVRVAIPEGAVGGSTTPLPNEVALCLTVTTDKMGRSTRGRTYLGGLSTELMAPDARFKVDVRDIGTSWGQEIIYPLHQNGDWAYNIFSGRHASAREAQGVYVGLVPDSQRSRRWHQNENPALVWGTASGLPVMPT